MLKNHFVTSVRTLIKYKGYSLINIAGLGIGIATATLIFLFVQDELGYDRHNEKFDRIYRVYLKGKIQDNEIYGAISNAPIGPAMVQEIPVVEHYTRIFTFAGEPVVRFGEKSFVEKKFYYVDSSFFYVFTTSVVRGDRSTFLTRPETLVLSEETAIKYFGDEDPTGKILEVGENRQAFEVVGVVKGFPENSHFSFDILAAGSTIFNNQNQFWISNNNYTYIVVQEGANINELQDQISAMVRKYVGPQMQQFIGVSLEEMEEAGQHYGYFLQPLKDIHLRSDLQFEIEPGGSMATVLIFSIIAIFIIIIAAINFMNLATARSSVRAHEVGIRKVVGSDRWLLIRQFLSESAIISFIGLLLAIGLVELVLPVFNQFTAKTLSLALFDNFLLLPVLLFIWIIVGLVSGAYPAFFLASFQPVKVLKGNLKTGMKTSTLRSILVVFQFAITIMLFISTFVVFRQMDFLNRKELGFERDNLVVISRAHILRDKTEAFRQEVMKVPGVTHAAYSNTTPGGTFGNTAFVPEGQGAEHTHAINFMITEEEFFDTYKLQLKEGRWFSRKTPSDSFAIVVNEATVKALGFENPLQHRVTLVGNDIQPLQIIGVVKDFHYESLHQTIKPLVIAHLSEDYWALSIRLQPELKAEVLSAIENIWKEFTNDQTIQMNFLEDTLAQQYRSEKSTGLIFSGFSLLAIFIASIGLLGPTSFSADQRTREVGIRKVMGAEITKIMALFMKEIMWLVLIATLIAWPLSYFFMKDWLQHFAFRIGLGPVIFVASTLLAFLIAIFTVSYRTYAAAAANPAESLRHE